jgi:hypothetical protein
VMTSKMGVETLQCYAGQHLAAPDAVGGVLLVSDSRRRCLLFLCREHTSAFGMTLKMGVETLWCYAGLPLAAPEGVCGVGGRRALGVGFAR